MKRSASTTRSRAAKPRNVKKRLCNRREPSSPRLRLRYHFRSKACPRCRCCPPRCCAELSGDLRGHAVDAKALGAQDFGDLGRTISLQDDLAFLAVILDRAAAAEQLLELLG